MSETRKAPGRGTAPGAGLAVAVVAARFNADLVDRLVESAERTLVESGVRREAIRVWRAPGAFELPLLAQAVIRAESPDAVVALGAVVRGETPHFDFVAEAAVQGLLAVSRQTGVPVALGIVTANTWDQAEARTRPPLDRGAEAARAAVEMAHTLADLRAGQSVPS